VLEAAEHFPVADSTRDSIQIPCLEVRVSFKRDFLLPFLDHIFLDMEIVKKSAKKLQWSAAPDYTHYTPLFGSHPSRIPGRATETNHRILPAAARDKLVTRGTNVCTCVYECSSQQLVQSCAGGVKENKCRHPQQPRNDNFITSFSSCCLCSTCPSCT
jgi:hypothetical protein